MNIKKFFEFTECLKKLFADDTGEYMCAPWVVCKDGFNMSVQNSVGAYCNYPEDAEVGFPSEDVPELVPYETSDNRNIFSYVPLSLIDEITQGHGGIIGYKWPYGSTVMFPAPLVTVDYKDGELDEGAYWVWCYCPNCKQRDIGEGYSFCPKCGVKIEWVNNPNG